MASKQEVFDKVKTHLLTQGRKSADGPVCLYRGPDGLKCAAGILIPDEKFSVRMENRTIIDPLVWHAIGLGIELKPLVLELQQVHDVFDVVNWPEALKKVAKDHGLKYE